MYRMQQSSLFPPSIFLLLLCAITASANWTVSRTDDFPDAPDTPGTLRWALRAANTAQLPPSTNATISFLPNITAVSVEAALPALAAAGLSLDGGEGRVEITAATSAAAAAPALVLAAPQVTATALHFTGFLGDGVVLAAHGVQASRIETTGCATGFRIQASAAEARLTDCTATESGDDAAAGIVLEAGAHNAVLASCTSNHGAGDGIHITGADSVELSDVVAENNAGHGLLASSCSALVALTLDLRSNGNDGAVLSTCAGCVIAGCSTYFNGRFGVFVLNAEHAAVYNTYAAGNGLDGIYAFGAHNLTVQGCHLGELPFADSSGLGNGRSGMTLISSGDVLVGDAAGCLTRSARMRAFVLGSSGNVFSGNAEDGLFAQESPRLHVCSNLFGLRHDGTTPAGNARFGIVLLETFSTRIAGSVMSSNGADGVLLQDAHGCTLVANLVGLAADGAIRRPNGRYGVLLVGGASSNAIGGPEPNDGNVISANAADGILFSEASGNTAHYNYIGLGADGLAAAGNTGSGIQLFLSHRCEIVGNVVGANGENGLLLDGAMDNTVTANTVGLAADGDTARGNQRIGVLLLPGSSGNIVGNENVVAHSGGNGVHLQDAQGCLVSGNTVGSTATGNPAPNGVDGIYLQQLTSARIEKNVVRANEVDGIVVDASDSILVIGNHVEAQGRLGVLLLNSHAIILSDNTISGSQQDGVRLESSAGCHLTTNQIGTDLTGLKPRPNHRHGINTRLSANVTLTDNVVCASGEHGLVIDTSPGVTVLRNVIGTDAATATLSGLGNTRDGIDIILGSDNVRVADNIVASNGGDGIYLQNVANATIVNNTCGLTGARDAALPNLANGISLVLVQGVLLTDNTLGGNDASGLHLETASDVAAAGNFFGLGLPLQSNSSSDTGHLANGVSGVLLVDVSRVTLADNVLAGNTVHGVHVIGGSSIALLRNRFGVAPGQLSGGNGVHGIFVESGCTALTILAAVATGNGGDGLMINGAASVTVQNGTFGSRDAPNSQGGIHIQKTANVTIDGCVIAGNNGTGLQLGAGTQDVIVTRCHIGVLPGDPGVPAANNGAGVVVATGASGVTVGGLELGAGNVIAYNTGAGVAADATAGAAPEVLSNSIFQNAGTALDVACAPGGCLATAQLLSALRVGNGLVEGVLASRVAPTNVTLQLFASPTCGRSGRGEGVHIVSSATIAVTASDGQTRFRLPLPVVLDANSTLEGMQLTATATAHVGGTSPFSACIQYGERYEACTVCSCTAAMVDCSDRSMLVLPERFPAETESLDLSYNPTLDLASWPANLTQALPALHTLRMRDANIRTLQPAWFAGHPQLQVLDLGANALTDGVNGWDLSTLTQLRELVLDHSGLTALPPAFVAAAPRLIRLDVSHNALAVLGAGVLGNSTTLQQLSIGFNPLVRLAPDALAGLPQLQTFDLRLHDSSADAAAVNVSAGVFRGMQALAVVQWYTRASCPDGYAPGFLDTSLCLRCPAGTHSAAAKLSLLDCKACALGATDDDDDAVTPCVACGPGTYTAGGARGECSQHLCPAGTADMDEMAATPCSICQAGSYAAPGSAGVAGCVTCVGDTTDHDNSAATPCLVCDDGARAPLLRVGPCFAAAVRQDVSTRATIATGVTLGVLALMLALAALVMRRRLRRTRLKHRAELAELHRQAQAEFEQLTSLQAEDMAAHFESLQVTARDLTPMRPLGEGEFGEVEMCRMHRDGTEVAVKRMRSSGVDFEQQKTFLLEAKIMAALNHPQIVAVLGMCTHATPFFLVMELMPLGDLRSYLHPPPSPVPPPALLVESCWRLSTAMLYLERLGLVHRDLAARNVLVAGDGLPDIKLADFGMSRPLDEKDYYRKTSNDRVPVKWMAPESLRFKTYSHKSDVWSFGILMWEVFSFGEVPYPKLTAMEAMLAVADGYRLPRPDTCPASLYDKVMVQLWHADPELRPPFVAVEAMLARECRAAGVAPFGRQSLDSVRPVDHYYQPDDAGRQRRTSSKLLLPSGDPSTATRETEFATDKDARLRRMSSQLYVPSALDAVGGDRSRRGSESSGRLSADMRPYRPQLSPSLTRAVFSSMVVEKKARRSTDEMRSGADGPPPVSPRTSMTPLTDDNYVAANDVVAGQSPPMRRSTRDSLSLGGMPVAAGGLDRPALLGSTQPASPLTRSVETHYEYDTDERIADALASAETVAAGRGAVRQPSAQEPQQLLSPGGKHYLTIAVSEEVDDNVFISTSQEETQISVRQPRVGQLHETVSASDNESTTDETKTKSSCEAESETDLPVHELQPGSNDTRETSSAVARQHTVSFGEDDSTAGDKGKHDSGNDSSGTVARRRHLRRSQAESDEIEMVHLPGTVQLSEVFL